MAVLVTGGAGYIGSHMVRALAAASEDVVVLDDLSSGCREAVGDAELVVADILDTERIEATLREHDVDVVMHFASRIEVGESVKHPEEFYRSIVGGTLSVGTAMIGAGVTRLVYSSSAAVYGLPEAPLLTEIHPMQPVNPYGRAKKMAEDLLADLGRAHDLASIALRYFNAAGAAADGSLGECHDPETHLIPRLLAVAAKRADRFSVFGTDYPTPDGTCVRDFVHVEDICAAHLLALERLREGERGTSAFNLGTGNGFSVREVVEAARRVTGKQIDVVETNRRPGDPAILVADASRARADLGWEPRHPSLDTIIAHAWAWERESDRL